MREFKKPTMARSIEARSRARNRRVRVFVIHPAYRYYTHAQSEPGVIYHIGRTRQGWTCTCRGYEYTGVCKHLAAVERRSEREGWEFGKIAPLVADRIEFDTSDPAIRTFLYGEQE